MNKQKNIENDSGLIITGVITVLIIIGIWYLTYLLLKDLEPSDRGTLGDMFGTINALFSGLAFAGIIFTILLQRKELRYQRDELKETREEFIIQNKTLKNQRFENTFFNLISIHNQIVNDIDYDKRTRDRDGSYIYLTVKGRDVFKDSFKRLDELLKNGSKGNHNSIYVNFYDERKTDFGHYFRNLYRIIKMVHETEFKSVEELSLDITKIDEKRKYELSNYIEKYKYTSIVRAQLSDYELLLLFYNCLSENGFDKFKPLVEEYALLKNLPKADVYDQNLIIEYSDSAYENKNKSSIN